MNKENLPVPNPLADPLRVQADPGGCSVWNGENYKVCELRGWGYLTGHGHIALGLSSDQAVGIQDQYAYLFAASVQMATALECAEDVERIGTLPWTEQTALIAKWMPQIDRCFPYRLVSHEDPVHDETTECFMILPDKLRREARTALQVPAKEEAL